MCATGDRASQVLVASKRGDAVVRRVFPWSVRLWSVRVCGVWRESAFIDEGCFGQQCEPQVGHLYRVGLPHPGAITMAIFL